MKTRLMRSREMRMSPTRSGDTVPDNDSDNVYEISNKLKQEPEWDPGYKQLQKTKDDNCNFVVLGTIKFEAPVKTEVCDEEEERVGIELGLEIEIENIKSENNNNTVSNLEPKTNKTPVAEQLQKVKGGKSNSVKRKDNSRRYGSFKCDACARTFGRKDQLQVHMRIHNDDKPYQCTACGKSFRTSGNLSEHMTTHSDDRPYKCETEGCGYRCKTKGQLRKHEKIHRAESRKHRCEVCNKSFIGPFFLRKHRQIHEKKPFGCKVCQKSFRDISSLIVHKKLHVNEAERGGAEEAAANTWKPAMHKDRLTCTLCQRSFNSNRNLEKHMFRHSNIRSHTCPVCDKTFKLKTTLDQHTQRVHAGREKVSCPTCGKLVVMLASHMAVHRDERPFPCRQCDWRFKTAGQLKAHVAAIHEATREHHCERCPKAFKNVYHLRRHVRMVHSDDKPFTCESCGKSYADKWCLGDHWKMAHSDFKGHACPVCSNRFKKRYQLNVHMAKRHKQDSSKSKVQSPKKK